MRVAIVGGTGDFGLALARRLVEAGDDVVIGSRDAGAGRRRRRAKSARPAPRTRRPSADVDLVGARDEGRRRARDRGRARGGARRRRRCSALRASCTSPAGVFPDAEARSLAERTQELVACTGRRRSPFARRPEARAWPSRRGRVRLRRRRRRQGARARARGEGRDRPRARRRPARKRARPRRA